MTQGKSVIILVHGAMGCNQSWKYQVEGLSHKIEIVALNLPGHFESESPKNPTISTYIEFLNDFIEQLKVDNLILGGHSMGGAVVLLYYFKHPEKVRGLILIGTGARLRVLPIILELSQKNIPQLVEMTKNAAFHKNTIKKKSELIREVTQNMSKTPSNIAFNDWNICNEFDVMESLKNIKVPTLIICGDMDKLTPVKYSKYLHEHIPDSSLLIIKGAGHMVMLEQPEAINNAIDTFIDNLLI